MVARHAVRRNERAVDPKYGVFSPQSYTVRSSTKAPILHAILGNSKLGKKVMSVSLVPVRTCLRGVPCARPKACYAINSWKMYKDARRAWRNNTALILNDPDLFEESVRQVCEKGRHALELFRWFPAGDFVNQEMVTRVLAIADQFPSIPFLAFTKRYDLEFPPVKQMPPNFQLIFSQWPGWVPPRPVPPDGRRAWASGVPLSSMPPQLTTHVKIGKGIDRWGRTIDTAVETRYPRNAFVCPGQCTMCKFCWNANRLKRDVVFHYHYGGVTKREK